MIRLEEMMQPYNQYALTISLSRQQWNDESGQHVRYYWTIDLASYYRIATGYGHSAEDALAIAGKAIVSHFIKPSERVFYQQVLPTPSSGDLSDRNIEVVEPLTKQPTEEGIDFWERLKDE